MLSLIMPQKKLHSTEIIQLNLKDKFNNVFKRNKLVKSLKSVCY